MIRLALIGSSEKAKIYAGLSTRLHRATWTVFAALDSGDVSKAFGSLAKVTTIDDLFSQKLDDFDAVVVDADADVAERIAKEAMNLSKPALGDRLSVETRAQRSCGSSIVCRSLV